MQKPKLAGDPIKFEVIKNALQAVSEEMSVALSRSAYSTNIKTRLDFSCGLFDRDLRMINQASNQPVHLGLLYLAVPKALKSYVVSRLEEGDGLLINDAHQGMAHLNDVCLISPLYHGDEQWGYVANLAHHVDVGGRAPGSIAVSTEIYQEGVIIPGTKILRKGELDEEVFNLLRANVRGKKEFAGDLRAQVASNKLAQRRMKELLDKFGKDAVAETIRVLYDYTERRTRFAIGEFPEGEYEGEGLVDDDGLSSDHIRIRAKVIIRGGEISVDLTGSDAQCPGPMNSTFPQSFSSCVYPLKTLLPPDIPANHGFYKVLKVIAPEGTVVNCSFPSAVVGGWEVGLKTVETVYRAFQKAMPERVAAEGKKTMYHLAFGGIDPRSQERFVFLETMAGGYGARPSSDGPDAVQAHHQNTENSPVEELEIGYPVILTRYELVPDSGGAGKYRGGLGLRREYMFRTNVTATILADTALIAPRGSMGGKDGTVSRFVLRPASGKAKSLRSKTTFEVEKDSVLSLVTPGGGGYGSALDREPSLILDDVKNGKVSAKAALTLYGVKVDH
ncbi:MAG: hydantoinase B/oxoprolinase family protein, partial [Nitrososphaerota archaeon]|nr:hydantoinase B/oxoprolinase family protein [Nitrososphaerota archaeon]